MSDDVIREALRGPPSCGEGVTRDGAFRLCGRTPVGLRLIWDEPYPVCAEHARADMVPLWHVVAAALRGDDA